MRITHLLVTIRKPPILQEDPDRDLSRISTAHAEDAVLANQAPTSNLELRLLRSQGGFFLLGDISDLCGLGLMEGSGLGFGDF